MASSIEEIIWRDNLAKVAQLIEKVPEIERDQFLSTSNFPDLHMACKSTEMAELFLEYSPLGPAEVLNWYKEKYLTLDKVDELFISRIITRSSLGEFIRSITCDDYFYRFIDVQVLERILSHLPEVGPKRNRLLNHFDIGKLDENLAEFMLDQWDSRDAVYDALVCPTNGNFKLHSATINFRYRTIQNYLLQVSSVSKRKNLIMNLRNLYGQSLLNVVLVVRKTGKVSDDQIHNLHKSLSFYASEYSITGPGCLIQCRLLNNHKTRVETLELFKVSSSNDGVSLSLKSTPLPSHNI